MTCFNYRILLTIILTVLLAACNSFDNYKLHIVFDNVEGLATKSTVTANGLQIGTVDNIVLYKDKVLVTTSIDNKVQIPVTSSFQLKSVDLFGQKCIDVHLDNSAAKNYADNDTIFGQVILLKNCIDFTTVKAVELRNVKGPHHLDKNEWNKISTTIGNAVKLNGLFCKPTWTTLTFEFENGKTISGSFCGQLINFDEDELFGSFKLTEEINMHNY
jgi:hypothetical protein